MGEGELMPLPWEKYGAQTVTPEADAPWAKYQQPAPEAAAPPRQMATAPAPVADRRTGFQQQVRQAISDPGLPVPIPTEQEFAQGFKDFGTGRLQGIPAQGLGLPGDVMSLANAGLGAVGAPQMPRLPSSSEVGNAMFGEPKNNLQAFGRTQAMEGPAVLAKSIGGLAKGTGYLAQQAFGLGTGAGAPAVKGAVAAGREGGQAAATFLEHMRSGVDVSDDAVKMAKDAVEEMRTTRGQAYRAGIGSTIKGDPTVLDFAPIDAAVAKVANVKTFKGQSLSKVADGAKSRIDEVIAEWKALDPAEFHTPEGLDALKQKLGDIIHEGEFSSLKPHSPASVIVNNAYNAVKDQVVKQAPGYGKVMKDYEEASKQIREIEASLSLGKKATTDTSLRKLQSILRNNANTNYGARVKSGDALAQYSPDLMPALSGQALNSPVPRGIQGALTGTGGLAGVTAALTGAMSPTALLGLLGASPRVVGESAFAMGNARRIGSNLLNPLKNAIPSGGGAGIPGIDPRLLAQMSPQMLNQLLLSTRAPAGQ